MRRSDALRAIMGFAKAIVADGDVSEGEAKGFQAWIDAHDEDVRGLPAVDEIVRDPHKFLCRRTTVRVRKMLS